MLIDGINLLSSNLMIVETAVFSYCNFPAAIITLDIKYETRASATSLPAVLDIEPQADGILVFQIQNSCGAKFQARP